MIIRENAILIRQWTYVPNAWQAFGYGWKMWEKENEMNKEIVKLAEYVCDHICPMPEKNV